MELVGHLYLIWSSGWRFQNNVFFYCDLALGVDKVCVCACVHECMYICTGREMADCCLWIESLWLTWDTAVTALARMRCCRLQI